MFYKRGDIVRIRPDIEEYRAKTSRFHMVNKIAEDGKICYDPAECWLPRGMMYDLKKIGLSTAFEIVENLNPRSYILQPIAVDGEEPCEPMHWAFVDEMLFGPWCEEQHELPEEPIKSIPDDALMSILSV